MNAYTSDGLIINNFNVDSQFFIDDTLDGDVIVDILENDILVLYNSPRKKYQIVFTSGKNLLSSIAWFDSFEETIDYLISNNIIVRD